MRVIALFPAAMSVPLLWASAVRSEDPKSTFWRSQKRGANCFNEVVDAEWWRAAQSAGIEFVRLAPNKWATETRDFLIGGADQYKGLVTADMETLLTVLGDADSSGMPVVITMLSLPGARWKQQNADRLDLRMWRDSSYWYQAAAFWRDLASRLRTIPNIVGYNILNEPTPSQVKGWNSDSAAQALNQFYRVVVRAIREVDSLTPIIIGGDDWASAAGLAALEPFEENNVLYAVHMYEPFEFTNRKINAGRLCYPDDLLRDQPDTIVTGEDILRAILAPVSAWQLKHSVPSNQIVVEEFGCNRINCGAAGYIADIIAICNRNQWHWAFYAFREDTWDGMDYELGTKPPGWEYWKAVERGEPARLPRMDNPIWTAIRHGLRARDTTGAVR